MKKSQIRKKILKKRENKYHKNLNINFNYILKILKNNKINGKIIGGYYPYNYEVDSLEILNKFEKKDYLISLPKTKKNFQMEFVSWSSKNPLSINKYGIPESISGKIVTPNILLVPMVAFDKKSNRVGYGGGFYDRYIKKNKKIFTIGLAFSFQEIKKVPSNQNDMKLDLIITEKHN